jgi:hypothetical protein
VPTPASKRKLNTATADHRDEISVLLSQLVSSACSLVCLSMAILSPTRERTRSNPSHANRTYNLTLLDNEAIALGCVHLLPQNVPNQGEPHSVNNKINKGLPPIGVCVRRNTGSVSDRTACNPAFHWRTVHAESATAH